MKPLERTKTTDVVDRISSGHFDLNDLDNLLMKLRPYCGQHKTVRDVADFVAHNEQRDQGRSHEAIEGLYLRMKFFGLYQTSHTRTKFDLEKPFPIWIRRLIILQVKKFEDDDFYKNFKKTKKQIESLVMKAIKIDDKKGEAKVISKKPQETFEIIRYLLSYLVIRPEFDGDQLIDELIAIMKETEIDFDEQGIRDQEKKIIISVLLLFHNTVFNLKNGEVGVCYVSIEQDGHLSCLAAAPLIYPNKEYVRIVFNLFETKLLASEWLGLELLKLERTSFDNIDLELGGDYKLKVLNKTS